VPPGARIALVGKSREVNRMSRGMLVETPTEISDGARCEYGRLCGTLFTEEDGYFS
jgi:hypothetical protein